ncbi:MAG: hypothetical protein AAF348_07585 [Bacteroidota bacterium]
MKKINTEEFENLKYGDKVYRFFNDRIKRYYFVAKMPKSETTYILCDGTDIISVFISKQRGLTDTFFSGEYNSEFIGKYLIENYEKKIRIVEEIYLSDGDDNF